MTKAKQLIMKNSLWNTIIVICKALRIPDATVAQWKCRGYVPPSRHHELVSTAEKLYLHLTHEQLHRQWRRARTIANARGK